ncbi:hypothetical protein BBOR36S_00775 [Brevibacillus borstelensis]
MLFVCDPNVGQVIYNGFQWCFFHKLAIQFILNQRFIT